MKKVAAVILLLSAIAWAKDTDPANYPLTVHVTTMEEVNTLRSSPVLSSSKGNVTGYSVTGSDYERVELRIGTTTYITTGPDTVTVGSDWPARVTQHHHWRNHWEVIDVLGKDKKGKTKVWNFLVEGRRE